MADRLRTSRDGDEAVNAVPEEAMRAARELAAEIGGLSCSAPCRERACEGRCEKSAEAIARAFAAYGEKGWRRGMEGAAAIARGGAQADGSFVLTVEGEAISDAILLALAAGTKRAETRRAPRAATLTEAQFAQQCAFIASRAAAWSGDCLTLPERHHSPADPAAVARFTSQMREKLRIIEAWAGVAPAS